MIAIVDYGVGNLFSLKSSLAAIGAEAVVAADPALLAAADKIILPGVGAFGDAAEKLRQQGITVKFAPCMRLCGKGPNLKWDGKLYHKADENLLKELMQK